MPQDPPLRSARPSLAFWLFTAAVLVTTIAVAAAVAWVDRLARAQARLEAMRFLEANAQVLRDALDRGMAQHLDEVRALSTLPQVAEVERPAQMRAAFDGLRNSFPQFAWLGLATPDGRVVAAADGLLEGADVSARPWFKGAAAGPFVGDVHAALLLEKLLPQQAQPWRFVDFALPVQDAQGRTVGILGAHLSWQWMAALKQDLSDRLVRERGAEALVLSADGKVLLGPAALQGRPLPGAADDRGYLWVRARSVGHGSFKGLGWTMVLRQPEDQAMAPYARLHRQMLASAALVCLLALPLLWWAARRMAAPLAAMAQALSGTAPGAAPATPFYREAQVLQLALDRHDARQREHAAQLQALAAGLEQRVHERTLELAEANQRLSTMVDELARSQMRVSSILEHSPDAFVAVDGQGRVTDWNRCAEAMFGWSRDQARGQLLSHLIVPAEQRAAHDAGMAAFARTGRGAVIGQRLEMQALRLDGQSLPVELSIGGLREGQGHVAFAFVRDIRERQQAQQRLADSESRLRAITDNLPVLISYIDRQQRVQFVNRTYELWMRAPVASALGRPLAEVVGPRLMRQREPALARALAGQRVEFEVQSTLGTVPRVLQTVYVPDVDAAGGVAGVYTLSTDITALRLAERRMAELALNDPLTGLANRRRFDERLPEALARAARAGSGTALMFLDIDHFKRINDSFGHAAGDDVLKAIAQRLAAAVRGTDFVARLAGDEFVVVLEGVHAPEEAGAVALKMTEAARLKIDVAGQLLSSTTSIGVAFLPAGAAATPQRLLALADRALYQAKAEGRDRHAVLVAAQDEAPGAPVALPAATGASA